MQLAKSLQWLPPGWMVEVKERPSGARDKIYIDPVSGLKFRSKREVLRYLGIPVPTAKNRGGSNDVPGVVEFTSKKTVIRLVQDGSLDKSLDWLPLNWQVELEERETGRVDRYYIDPISGFRFSSKNEVSRYLQNGEMPKRKQRRRSDEGQKFTKKRFVARLVQDGSLDKSFDWLPLNWQVELKERETGRIDRYYIDPISGFRFSSKNEVSRYLQNGEMPKRKRRRRSDEGMKFTKKRIVARLVQDGSLDKSFDWLPLNWQVELKERETGRVDRYYIDPVYGYKFWSKNEVSQYLQNGEMPKRMEDAGRKFLLPSAAKIRKLACSRTRKGLFTGRRSNTTKVENNKGVIKLSDVFSLEQRSKGLECDNVSKLGLLLPNIGDSGNRNSDRAYDSKEHIVALSAVFPQKRKEHNSVGKSRNKKLKPNPLETENRSVYRMPCRTSRRLAGLDPELPTGMGKGIHVPLAELTAEVFTEKDMHSLGAEQQPNDLGNTNEGGDAAADYTMKLVSEEPESKVTLPRAEGDTEKDVPSLGGEEKPNERGETYEGGEAPTDYTMKLASDEPESEVALSRDEGVTPLGGEEKPNKLGKKHEEGDAAADYTIGVVSKEPESRVTLPKAKGVSEKFVPSLGGEKRPNEETYEGRDTATCYTIKLVSDEPESEVALLRLTEKYNPSFEGEEQPHELGKTNEEGDAAAEYTINVVSEEPESKVPFPRAEGDTEKDVPSLGGEEQPNELGKTYEEGDTAADYMMKIASEESESEVALPRAEGDTEKYVPFLGSEEQPNEHGKTSDDKDAPVDYPVKLASLGLETETTMTDIQVDAEIDKHSLGGEEQPNHERGKTLEDKDTPGGYQMKLKTTEDDDAPVDNPMKLAFEEPKSEIRMFRVEDGERDTHFLDNKEKLKEQGKIPEVKDAPGDYQMKLKTNEDEDAPGDYPLKLAFRKPKSETPMPRVEIIPRPEMDEETEIHSGCAEETLNEHRERSESRVAPTDYGMNSAFDGPQSRFTLPFGEPSLDPCLEFAYKMLTGIIPIENLPIKLNKHVTPDSIQNTGCLKWQDLHSLPNLSLDG